jgi:hypothetical protein
VHLLDLNQSRRVESKRERDRFHGHFGVSLCPRTGGLEIDRASGESMSETGRTKERAFEEQRDHVL